MTVEEFVKKHFREAQLAFEREGIGQEISNLSVFEKTIIYKYALDYYEDLNINLRYGGLTPIQQLFTRFLNEALDKLPDFKGVVYRGVALNPYQIKTYVQAFEHKEIIIEKSFVSSSREVSIAEQFNKGKVTFIIDSKRGKSIEMLSHYGMNNTSSEAEVLFKSATHFIVRGVESLGAKCLIYLKETDMEDYTSLFEHQSKFEELEMSYISQSLLSSFIMDENDLKVMSKDKNELQAKYKLLTGVLDAVTKKYYSKDEWNDDEAVVYLKAIYKLSSQKELLEILLANDSERHLQNLEAASARFAKKMQSSV